MVRQYRFRKPNQKRYRKLLNISSVPQSTSQSNTRITDSQQLPWNSQNGLDILSWKNTTPHYWPLYTIVSIHCCFKQKSRYNNQGNIQNMDLSLWFSWKIPHRQRKRVCKQQLYTIKQKFWNNSQNNSRWITLEQWLSRATESYSIRYAW